MSLSVSLSFRTCYIIKIFQMTTKMVKQLITMTIMRMTSTLGCYCHFVFSFFFLQIILNPFLVPVEQLTASNLRILRPNWFVISFAYFCCCCLFVCLLLVTWAFRRTLRNNYLHWTVTSPLTAQCLRPVVKISTLQKTFWTFKEKPVKTCTFMDGDAWLQNCFKWRSGSDL